MKVMGNHLVKQIAISLKDIGCCKLQIVEISLPFFQISLRKHFDLIQVAETFSSDIRRYEYGKSWLQTILQCIRLIKNALAI